MSKCVMCDKAIPPDRAPSDTCSPECAINKMAAWNKYLVTHKGDVMAAAIKEWRRTRSVGQG